MVVLPLPNGIVTAPSLPMQVP